jgi:DNA-directed RNA polymerase subunit RPC12/RpoP
MAIEFRCASCQQLLRVSDDSAGKNARCPKCSSLVLVPAAGVATPELPAGLPPAPLAPVPPAPPKPPAGPPAWQFGDPAQPSGGAGNPFSPSSSAAAPNPYAASAPAWQPQMPMPHASGAIVPQRVGVDPIFNYAWQVWKQNLGLLAGTTLVVLLISAPIDFATNFIETMLRRDGDDAAAGLVGLLGSILGFLVDTYLGIGQALIALKLARGQRAEFGDLFSGGSRYLPVLGGSLLGGIVAGVAFLLCIVPGVILCLMFWPFYYLVVDNKYGVMDSFGVANKITEGNWGTAFLLWLLSIVIGLCGFLALCVGIIFAIPLITMLWTTAYLMMSGQMATMPGYAPPSAAAGFGQPAGSPFGAK